MVSRSLTAAAKTTIRPCPKNIMEYVGKRLRKTWLVLTEIRDREIEKTAIRRMRKKPDVGMTKIEGWNLAKLIRKMLS